MTSLFVEVTAEQIAEAEALPRGWADPVEAALAQLTGQDVSIDGDLDGTIATIGQDEWTLVINLPSEASAWLNARFDDRSPGEPFSFRIEVPTWLTDLLAREAIEA